jgi:lipoprotein-anchoring transpeptidase ErfK/SrfK
MLRVGLALLAYVLATGAAEAQSGWLWGDGYAAARPRAYDYQPQRRQGYGAQRRPANPSFDDDDDDDEKLQLSDEVRSGGPRPAISRLSPQTVPFRSEYAPGTVVIDTSGRKLYLVTSSTSALRYPVSVGREGFTWTGTEKISRVADWPDWHPPEEMRERDPKLPMKMTGGLYNPLGAKALYLSKSLYRIHGTSDPRSIGRAASSGCFRMMNGHVVDLASRVGIGTRVVVRASLPPGTLRLASN